MPATAPLNPTTIIQRNEQGFLANSLGDETVMMNMQSGDYLGINSVGTDVWNLLKEPLAVSELIKQVVAMYDVSEEVCTAQINAFLVKMQEQDMLIIKTL